MYLRNTTINGQEIPGILDDFPVDLNLINIYEASWNPDNYIKLTFNQINPTTIISCFFGVLRRNNVKNMFYNIKDSIPEGLLKYPNIVEYSGEIINLDLSCKFSDANQVMVSLFDPKAYKWKAKIDRLLNIKSAFHYYMNLLNDNHLEAYKKLLLYFPENEVNFTLDNINQFN